LPGRECWLPGEHAPVGVGGAEAGDAGTCVLCTPLWLATRPQPFLERPLPQNAWNPLGPGHRLSLRLKPVPRTAWYDLGIAPRLRLEIRPLQPHVAPPRQVRCDPPDGVCADVRAGRHAGLENERENTQNHLHRPCPCKHKHDQVLKMWSCYL